MLRSFRCAQIFLLKTEARTPYIYYVSNSHTYSSHITTFICVQRGGEQLIVILSLYYRVHRSPSRYVRHLRDTNTLQRRSIVYNVSHHAISTGTVHKTIDRAVPDEMTTSNFLECPTLEKRFPVLYSSSNTESDVCVSILHLSRSPR